MRKIEGEIGERFAVTGTQEQGLHYGDRLSSVDRYYVRFKVRFHGCVTMDLNVNSSLTYHEIGRLPSPLAVRIDVRLNVRLQCAAEMIRPALAGGLQKDVPVPARRQALGGSRDTKAYPLLSFGNDAGHLRTLVDADQTRIVLSLE